MKIRRKHAASGGFTLIELMVVISIIGLLSSIIVASLVSARTKSRDAKRLQEKNQFIKALNLAYNELGGWPQSASGGTDFSCVGPGSETCYGGTYSGYDPLVTQLASFIKPPLVGTSSGNFFYNRILYTSNWPTSGPTRSPLCEDNQPDPCVLIKWFTETKPPDGSCPIYQVGTFMGQPIYTLQQYANGWWECVQRVF